MKKKSEWKKERKGRWATCAPIQGNRPMAMKANRGWIDRLMKFIDSCGLNWKYLKKELCWNNYGIHFGWCYCFIFCRFIDILPRFKLTRHHLVPIFPPERNVLRNTRQMLIHVATRRISLSRLDSSSTRWGRFRNWVRQPRSAPGLGGLPNPISGDLSQVTTFPVGQSSHSSMWRWWEWPLWWWHRPAGGVA